MFIDRIVSPIVTRRLGIYDRYDAAGTIAETVAWAGGTLGLRAGPSTSPVEVTNVSPHGFWLFVGERELFVPFNDFPWFREASVREITNVQRPSPHHLHWPDLDIDLAVESIEHPEKYPLISKAPHKKRLPSTAARARGKKQASSRRG